MYSLRDKSFTNQYDSLLAKLLSVCRLELQISAHE